MTPQLLSPERLAEIQAAVTYAIDDNDGWIECTEKSLVDPDFGSALSNYEQFISDERADLALRKQHAVSLRALLAHLSQQPAPAREGVTLPMGVERVDEQRLKEILSGYQEFDAADYFEIRSLAYEVRNSRMAVAKADATYACSSCDWGGELPKFVNTADNSYRVACPKCGEQAEINPPVWP